MASLHEHREQSIPNVNSWTGPTQFSLVPIDRLVYLVSHYEAMKVDAETLPASPDRPPLPYVERTLRELRRELLAREWEATAA